MIRVITRAVYFGSNAITTERAADAGRVRLGDSIWLGPGQDYEHRRFGEHRVIDTCVVNGVIYVEMPVHIVTPTAACWDFVFADEREQPWSPYP